jgi:hypothetical protein
MTKRSRWPVHWSVGRARHRRAPGTSSSLGDAGAACVEVVGLIVSPELRVRISPLGEDTTAHSRRRMNLGNGGSVELRDPQVRADSCNLSRSVDPRHDAGHSVGAWVDTHDVIVADAADPHRASRDRMCTPAPVRPRTAGITTEQLT